MERKLDISTGKSVKSLNWKTVSLEWAKLVERFKTPFYTPETYKEFIEATKEEQTAIKDVGGYVGGVFSGKCRKKSAVLSRSLLTLDLDFAEIDTLADLDLVAQWTYVLHSTHKHSSETPRYRLIIPLLRDVSPEEYEALARKVAEMIGINYFDGTTFQANRLMFWQSTSKNAEYVFDYQQGSFLDPDKYLSMYRNWKDVTEWAVTPTEKKKETLLLKNQEDPTTKKGVIGLFCRAYSVGEAIDTFLNEVYTPTAIPDRYTYSKGSTAGGVVIYDNKFSYSHHNTDPCSLKLCNAYDLVRLHKFGHLDTPEQKKSGQEMEKLILADTKVREVLASEKIEEAEKSFDFEMQPSEKAASFDWLKELDIDRNGKYLSTSSNINKILNNDPQLKNAFGVNSFDNKVYVLKNLAWRKVKGKETIKDVDLAGLRNYIETIYGISSAMKINDAFELETLRNSFHPIKEYIEGLRWDGVQRIDTLLSEYLGVDANIYTAEALRKMLVGAIARIYEEKVKFDLVLTLVGEQGTGKSTLIRKLGKAWFSDSIYTMQGKESFEQLQGYWVIELAELAACKKAEIETVKHFISKQEDVFRAAYGHFNCEYPRRCVFFATTNKKDFLKDPTGNRRFMPIDVKPDKADKNIFTDFTDEVVDMVWAEAFCLYQQGETLYLSPESEKLAKNEQNSHSESDERVGLIEDYLNRKLPLNWEELDIFQRRAFLESDMAGEVEREYVCVAEIWTECLGKPKSDMDRYKTRELNVLLQNVEGWIQYKQKRFKLYGKQTTYVRKHTLLNPKN